MKKAILLPVLAVAICGCLTECPCQNRAVAKHVVLVGVDGLGAQWIPWDKMPVLSQLRKDGLYAVGRCNFPTASAINWASVMFGTVVEIHGYRRWNSQKPDVPAFEVTDKGIPPCLIHEIKKQDPSAYTVSLYNWGGISFVHATNEVDYVRNISNEDTITAEGLAQFKAHRPKLSFLYYGSPDGAGHKYGWGSPEFTNACIKVDGQVGRLVEGLKKMGAWEDTAIVLVADHGGLGKKHGMDNLECFEVPFLVSGPAVKGMRMREPVLLADTAPTVVALLGYSVPETWRGRPAVVGR